MSGGCVRTRRNDEEPAMFGWLKKDPRAKLQKAYEAKLTEAMTRQRNGDIRGYSALTAEAEAIKSQMDDLATKT